MPVILGFNAGAILFRPYGTHCGHGAIDSCIKNVLLSLLEVIGYATSW